MSQRLPARVGNPVSRSCPYPAKFISHRATVVVEKTGKVAFADNQDKTGDERDWAPILAAVKKLG